MAELAGFLRLVLALGLFLAGLALCPPTLTALALGLPGLLLALVLSVLGLWGLAALVLPRELRQRAL